MNIHLSKVNKDIRYLSRSSSFGGGFRRSLSPPPSRSKTPLPRPPPPSRSKTPPPIPAIDTGIINTICGIPVHIYYYTVKNALVLTPAGVHTSYSNNYEGPQHPMCKIEIVKYNNYIFNEGGIKVNGTNVIFSTEKWENNNPDNYDDSMLLGVLLACFYSLYQRLDHYIKLIYDQGVTIDYGHNSAPFYTRSKINILLNLFKNPKIKQCAEDFINNFKPFNMNQLMILFDEIKIFSSDNLPERKKFIIDMYNTPKTFNTPRIPLLPASPTLKPIKLFR